MPALDTSPASTPVLLIHAARDHDADVREKLVATGVFSAVDVFDAEYATPAPEDLAGYDAVLVYSDHSFDDAEALGDLLADYVDGGGGVVQAVFASGLVSLAGRFDAEGYEAIAGSDQGQNRPMSMVVVDGAHPLLQDVAAFDGGTGSFHTSDAALTDGAAEVAEWTNGLPLVAYKGRVVDLNFFPPSSDDRADFWVAGTDGDLLVRNALLFAAGRFASEPQGEGGPDADGDGVTDDEDACPGAMDAADADGDGTPDACDPCPFDEADACASACGEGDEDEDEDDEDDDGHGRHPHGRHGWLVSVRCDSGAGPGAAFPALSLLALAGLRRRR